MNVFITGLCLQGNKGGPAIALSLIRQLELHLGPCRFTLAVPATEFDLEMKWSRNYGIPVVADLQLRDVVPFLPPGEAGSNLRRMRRWLAAFRRADIIIDMSGVCYVGPPSGSTVAAVETRFRNFLAARMLGKPFLAWTQSYGPFTTLPISLMARMDLRRQPVVFCRGSDCSDTVTNLVPTARVETFPDVALALGFDRSWGAEYIAENWPEIGGRPILTISPSAVMYGQSEGSGANNAHVRDMAALVDRQTTVGMDVLMVPHTLRPNRRVPDACDLAVADLVQGSVTNKALRIVDEDLSPVDLKSIISNAHVHVGARYHSIVAALSSGVPCLSLSWHEKYTDIMRQFGMERYVWHGVGAAPTEDMFDLVDSLIADRDRISEMIQAAYVSAVRDVGRNAEEFTRLMKATTRT